MEKTSDRNTDSAERDEHVGIVIPGLDEFKKAAKLEGIILSLYDNHAMRMLAAWLIYPHQWNKPKEKAPLPADREYTKWAWSWITVDVSLLARMADVSAWDSVRIWEMLKMARMVFPDGTIHDRAKTLVVNMARSGLRGKE
jgi:hypothetical protein